MAVKKSNTPRLNQLISQGAEVINDKKPKKKVVFIQLRIPGEMFEDIEREVKACGWMSRTGWILDAIQNKIKNGE
jgi:hypothetical protein